MSRTGSAANALLKYESGQQFFPATAMADSGDHQTFTLAAAPWSGRAGREAVVRPDGLITGGAISPGSGNNAVSVEALTAYQGGQFVAVAGGSVSASRASTKTHMITSVILTDSGALGTEAGTEGDSFSESRGAAGGPPLIPEGAIEVGQVRCAKAEAAAVSAAEIYQVPGAHQELYDFPVWDEDPGRGAVTFAAVLPLIHAGRTPRKVFAEVYKPIFAPMEPTSDFKAAEESHSQTSQQVYGGTVGSSSTSLTQGSFTAYAKDGVTDPIVNLKGETLWWQFFPHRLRSPHLLQQAVLGISREFPAGDSIKISCTLSASAAAIEVNA